MLFNMDRLGTDIFVKSTNRKYLLHSGRNHLRKIADPLPWSQLVRVRRLVIREELVDHRLDEMCGVFLRCGYLRQLIQGYRMKAKGRVFWRKGIDRLSVFSLCLLLAQIVE